MAVTNNVGVGHPNVRFLFEEDGSRNFTYKTPATGEPIVLNAKPRCKVADERVIVDAWVLNIRGTKWSRTLFRLKHPIIYTKRLLRGLRRKIRRLFFKDPPMNRVWATKEALLHLYPDKEKK